MLRRVSLTSRFTAVLLLAGAASLFQSSLARADGLFYRLPADGTSAKYDLHVTSDREGEPEITGSMTMSSVGTTKHDDKPARWIEVVMTMRRGDDGHSIIAKLLIPEQELQPGGAPFENFIKCYVKMDEGEARPLDGKEDDAAGPLPFFLSGPIMTAKKLEPKVIDCALGSVECGGVAGKTSLKQGGGVITIEFETRLNDRAPFGVVASKMQFSNKHDERVVESGTIELKLTEIDKNAASALPDIGAP